MQQEQRAVRHATLKIAPPLPAASLAEIEGLRDLARARRAASIEAFRRRLAESTPPAAKATTHWRIRK